MRKLFHRVHSVVELYNIAQTQRSDQVLELCAEVALANDRHRDPVLVLHSRQRTHCIVQPVSLQDRTVKSEMNPSINLRTVSRSEQFVICKVCDDFNGRRIHSVLLDENMVLDQIVNSDDLICKECADLLLPEKKPEEQSILSFLELGGKGIRHRIVNIQNDLRPHQLWQQCAEDEKVGHVVHVYDAVAPLELQPRGLNEASKEELK